MKRSFILLGCLLSVALLQAESLSNEYSGCPRKKDNKNERHFDQGIYLGCGCGGGGGGGSNEIPPDSGK